MIGLFDSGDGGLPALATVRKLLPQYSYLYLGDHARAPYGSRSSEEIFAFTWQAVKYLFEQGCVLVILACNTASANALRRIQQELLPSTYPDRRVLGILVPTVEQIANGTSEKSDLRRCRAHVARQRTDLYVSSPLSPRLASHLFSKVPTYTESSDASLSNTVLVLGTLATINSHAYVIEVQKRNPNRRVIQQACPELVSLIENTASHARLNEVLATYLAPYQKTLRAGDAVMLGCTHYELIKEMIAEHLPIGVTLYSQSEILAQSLKSYLERHPEIETRLKRDGSVAYLTTAEPPHLSIRAPFSHITLS